MGEFFGCSQKGDTVEVVKGRKVPIGTTGVVIWKGHGQWGTRVGIKDAAGTVHWTSSSNVEVRSRPAPPPPVKGKWSKGDKVCSADGRIGRVFWVGPDRQNPTTARYGVTFKGESGTFFGEDELAALVGRAA